jgi:general secretion pathway protein K
MNRIKAEWMRRTVLDNTRGVALLLTIMAVTIIIALSVQFNRAMRDQVVSSGNVDHGLKALSIAKSGISFGLAVLTEDSRKADTLLDDWADPDKMGGLSEASHTLFAGGHFDLTIEDLSARIQINSLVDIDELSKVFERLLQIEEFDLKDEEICDIFDSVMDWVDKAGEDDDLTRLCGAEDDYYMALEPPYHCKNGPFDTLEEILMVKGMRPELFYGNKEGDKEKPGLDKLVTVFGDEKININTADPKILRSLHEEITKSVAEDMAAYRVGKDETDLELTSWVELAGLSSEIKIPEDIITTRSTHFRIISKGHFGDVSKQVVAVVKRAEEGKQNEGGKEKEKDGDLFQILSWEVE